MDRDGLAFVQMAADLETHTRVEILARYSTEEGSARRLCNVVGIGTTSLLLELDADEFPDGTSIAVGFVVPGTADRVMLGGRIRGAAEGPTRGLLLDGALPAALQEFLQRRKGNRGQFP